MYKSCFVKFYATDRYNMKSYKKERIYRNNDLRSKHGYKVRYVLYEVIDDYSTIITSFSKTNASQQMQLNN
jgi:transposase InsO family protein